MDERSWTGATVLVVEDDADVRAVSVAIVEGLGYRVLQAAAGREALLVLRGADPVDLLFTDVVLPGGMHGPALARAARAVRPGLRVLYTSGYVPPAACAGEPRLDAQLLDKPYDEGQLAAALRRALADS